MVEESKEHRPITPAEPATRNEGRRAKAKRALADHELAQKAFDDNRTRLKVERLAREASELKAKGK